MIDTVVLLHGFTGSPASFGPIVADLPRHVRVVAPMLGGHGPTPSLPTSWDDELDRLLALLEGERVERAHLLGYSLGGRLAWGLLDRAPKRFTSATILGGHPGLRDQASRSARAAADRRWIELLEREGLEAFVAAWEALPLFATQSPEQIEAQRAIRLSHRPEGLACALRTLGQAAMPAIDPARIEVPVTLLVGELDRSSSAAALPEAGRVLDAGHNLLIERPDLLRALLAEKLA